MVFIWWFHLMISEVSFCAQIVIICIQTLRDLLGKTGSLWCHTTWTFPMSHQFGIVFRSWDSRMISLSQSKSNVLINHLFVLSWSLDKSNLGVVFIKFIAWTLKHNSGEMIAIQDVENQIVAVLENEPRQQANGDELKTALLDSYERFRERWQQCNQMTRLRNFHALKVLTTDAIALDENAWFYIGFTDQALTSFYLWDKHPQNEQFLAMEEQHGLVKSRTYYTYLQGNEGESEHILINEFVQDGAIIPERCLNVNPFGKGNANGIVYVLVYTQLRNQIEAVRGLLQQQVNGDELKPALLESFDKFWERWQQCAQVTRVGNYDDLRGTTDGIANAANKWFYIGFTGEPLKPFYLLDKHPQNQRFPALKEQHNLVKTHTYYTHLQPNDGGSEDNLIKRFVQDGAINHERCLNVDPCGQPDPKGIVYVLVYTPAN